MTKKNNDVQLDNANIDVRRDFPKTTSPLRAIRLKCCDCVGGRSAKAIEECEITLCPLHAFRLGRNPYRKKQSEAQRQASRENMRKLQARKQADTQDE